MGWFRLLGIFVDRLALFLHGGHATEGINDNLRVQLKGVCRLSVCSGILIQFLNKLKQLRERPLQSIESGMNHRKKPLHLR